jgi:hypothetical protein
MRVWDKHSSLFDSFVSYKENYVNEGLGAVFTTLYILCYLKIGLMN